MNARVRQARRFYGADLLPGRLLFDILEAEDARCFPKTACASSAWGVRCKRKFEQLFRPGENDDTGGL